MQETKDKALKSLKAGFTVDQVSTKLDISPALVREWYDSIKDDIIENKHQEIVVLDRAAEIISKDVEIMEANRAKLQDEVEKKALEIIKLMTPMNMQDPETVKSLYVASGIITSMQNTFFKVTAQVGPAGDGQEVSQTKVSKFQGLRD